MIRNRLLAAMAAVLVAGVGVFLAWFVYQTPGSASGDRDEHRLDPLPPSSETVLVTVDQGESPAAIGASLREQGVIRSGRLFEVLVGVTGVQDALQAGEYELNPGMTAIEVVHRIAEGRTASRRVTIPEGLRVEEVGDILEVNKIVTKDAFLAALHATGHSEPFLRQIDASDLEGYVFPAGYEFSREATADDVVDAMLRGFQDNVADGLQLEGQALSLEQAVTLASIVQREAGPAEWPLVASVFLNRLRLGIPLEADPTVQFAVAQHLESIAAYGYWKEGVTLDDLKIDSPYNTYVYAGLPPGPIANPGLGAIEAVIRPAQSNYLFFVSKGDGTHAFAETLEEHIANIEKYQH